MVVFTMASAVPGGGNSGSKDVLGHALDIHEFGDEELVGWTRQLGFFAALDVSLGPEGVLVIEMQYEFGYAG